MIPKKLRSRLEKFIADHSKCSDDFCVYKAATEWADELEAKNFPREELLIMALAYQAYLGREVAARKAQRRDHRTGDDFIPPSAKPKLKVVR